MSVDVGCTALLDAIRANPDDDAPRLVFADWLDENGQPERAQFIRLQVDYFRYPNVVPNRKTWKRCFNKLLREHQESWLGDMAWAL